MHHMKKDRRRIATFEAVACFRVPAGKRGPSLKHLCRSLDELTKRPRLVTHHQALES